MGYYYVNSAVICAAIVGAIVFWMESVALAADVKFTQSFQYNFKNDDLCKHFLNNATADGKDFELLRRDLPFEPMFMFILGSTVIVCVVNTIITWIFRTKRKTLMLMLLNKAVSISITVAFISCGVLLCMSFIIYDLKYLEYTNGEITGCNLNYHHEDQLDADCDKKYSVCQMKELKAASFTLCLVCVLLGLCAIVMEIKAKNTLKAFEESFKEDKTLPHPVAEIEEDEVSVISDV